MTVGHRTPTTKCPECGHMLDAATDPEDDQAVPAPGDISLCLHCRHVLVFDDDLSLREPTAKELVDLAIDGPLEKLRVMQDAIKRTWEKGGDR